MNSEEAPNTYATHSAAYSFLAVIRPRSTAPGLTSPLSFTFLLNQVWARTSINWDTRVLLPRPRESSPPLEAKLSCPQCQAYARIDYHLPVMPSVHTPLTVSLQGRRASPRRRLDPGRQTQLYARAQDFLDAGRLPLSKHGDTAVIRLVICQGGRAQGRGGSVCGGHRKAATFPAGR